MSLITLSIANRVFDQDYLEIFIQLLNRPYMRVEEMIRIDVQHVLIECVSITQPGRRFILNSVADIDHMEFAIATRDDDLQFPYDRIIAALPDVVVRVFILKIYFTHPHETIESVTLFIGLDDMGIIRHVKELCWNCKTKQMFQLRTMLFSFSAYLHVPECKKPCMEVTVAG